MTSSEIVSLCVSVIGVLSFAIVFTILYGNYINSFIEEVQSGKKDIELIDEIIYENLEKVKKRRKTVGIIKSVLFYVIIIFICVPLLTYALYSKINNTTPMINGNGVLVVASGSMSYKNENNVYLKTENLNNQFNTYDIIVVEKVNSVNDIEKYDVIAFVNDKGMNVIHRVIDIKYEDGKTVFVTRGDSNKSSDAYNPTFDDLIGVYTNKRVKTLGIFVMFFQSYQGMVTILAVIYCIMMTNRYNSKSENAVDRRVSKLIEAIEYDPQSSSDEFYACYNETIYYKDTAYHFGEDGLIKKEKVDPETLEKIKQLKEN